MRLVSRCHGTALQPAGGFLSLATTQATVNSPPTPSGIVRAEAGQVHADKEASVASPIICRSALAIEAHRGVESLANTARYGQAMRLALRSDGCTQPTTSDPQRGTSARWPHGTDAVTSGGKTPRLAAGAPHWAHHGPAQARPSQARPGAPGTFFGGRGGRCQGRSPGLGRAGR